MKFKNKITGKIEEFGIHQIDSSLISAQNRKRLYWTNIPNITQPEDKGVVLHDILEDGKDDLGVIRSHGTYKLRNNKSMCIDANYWKGPDNRRARTIILKHTSKDGCNELGTADIRGHNLIRRVYSIWGKCPTLTAVCGGHQEKKIAVNSHEWRKLTPIECERLQTIKPMLNEVNFKICLDQAKSYVDAVKKNHKLLNLVENVEKSKLKEFANYVASSTSQSHQQTRHTARQSVNMQIRKKIKGCIEDSQDDQFLNAGGVEREVTSSCQNQIADSVVENVFMRITEGRITRTGREEYLQQDKDTLGQESGKIVLNVCGKEMEQLVNFVENYSDIKKISSSTYITLSHLSIRDIEIMLIILYYYAEGVIDTYTQKRMLMGSLSLRFERGYTLVPNGIGNRMMSNSARYKMLGNGWTVDVIAHILSHIPGRKRNDD